MASLAEHLDAADLAGQGGGSRVTFGPWTDAVRRNVLRFRFDCDRPLAFAGTITNRTLAGVSFINMASERHAAYRDHDTISPADAGFYVLTLQLSGELRLAQNDQVTVLRPGRFAIYDSARPAALTVSDDYTSTCIRFPKELLGTRDTDPLAGIVATSFDCEPGLRSAVWGMLISLNRNLETLGPHGGAAVRNVMDLVVTMLRTDLHPEGAKAAQPHETLLRKVRAYIDENLSDPGLGPGRIAAAHYISPRHLHHLFERTDATVAGWIRERRIEQCKRDLADPALRGVPVSAIAARWGFRGASHFGHVFKSHTGLTPAEFRRQARDIDS